MSISNRFHLFVASTTIAMAYWISTRVTITVSSWTTLTPIAKLAGAYVGSAAFYQFIATLLRWIFDHVRILRKLIFGNEFLEGTWIGAYGQSTGKRFTVEHFEQTVDGIVIRGYAFTDADALYAKWTSRSVSFDPNSGSLTYSYDCDILGDKTSHQGIAFFSVQRTSTRKAASGMNGYSADLVDGSRSTNLELKLSDKQVDLAEARGAAKKRF
jgi:hypothetical protein